MYASADFVAADLGHKLFYIVRCFIFMFAEYRVVSFHDGVDFSTLGTEIDTQEVFVLQRWA